MAPQISPAFIERLEVAGVEDPRQALEFFNRLRSAVRRNDREAVLGMLRFRFTRYWHGTPRRRYDSAEEMAKDYDRIFTPGVLHAIDQAVFNELFANWKGVMIGRGEVWFRPCEDGLWIIAVNS